MSNISALKEAVDTVSQKLSELDDQLSKSDEYMLCLTNEVEDHVRQIQAEMTQNRTEYERIIGEYQNAQHLLHQLEVLKLNGSSRSYSNGNFGGLDSIAKAFAPGHVANREVTGPGAVPDEDHAEVDPDQVRLGFQHMFKKKGNGVSKATETQELAS